MSSREREEVLEDARAEAADAAERLRTQAEAELEAYVARRRREPTGWSRRPAASAAPRRGRSRTNQMDSATTR